MLRKRLCNGVHDVERQADVFISSYHKRYQVITQSVDVRRLGPVPGGPAHLFYLHGAAAAAAITTGELLEFEAGERRQHATRQRRPRPEPGAVERGEPPPSSSHRRPVGAGFVHETGVVMLLLLLLMIVVLIVAVEIGRAGMRARKQNLLFILLCGERGARPRACNKNLSVLLRHNHLLSPFAAAGAIGRG